MEASLTHEEFTNNVNSKFQVQLDQHPPVDLELTEISEIKRYPHQEQFSVIFRGPLDMFLDQGTRYFTHDQMGEFDLFIVPIKQDEQGFYYQAIFNRLRE